MTKPDFTNPSILFNTTNPSILFSTTIPSTSVNTTPTKVTTNLWEDQSVRFIAIGSASGIGLLACIVILLCIGITYYIKSVRSNIKPKIIEKNVDESQGRLFIQETSVFYEMNELM